MAKPRAKKKCIKGYACGYTCIKRGKVCRKNASTEAKQAISAYVNAATNLKDVRLGSKQIGEGAFGIAYLTPNNTVVKTIAEDEITPNEAKLSKLMGEAGYGPKVISIGKLDGANYIEMEYLDGYRTAYNRAAGGTVMSEQQAAKLLEAIAYMHKNGYAHNDMHMFNVMVNDATGDAKLIDFGIADDVYEGDIADDLERFAGSGHILPADSPQAKVLAKLHPSKGNYPIRQAREAIIKDYVAELNEAKPEAKPEAKRAPKEQVAFVNANTKIEDLMLGKRIGNGAYGDVYETPNGTVAKIIDSGLDQNEVKAQKIVGDAGYAPKLLYGGGVNGVGIIEMEQLKGYKPASKLSNGYVSEGQAKKLMEGIEFMHKNGLTHTDLHKGNVMVNTKTDDAKLIDFGLSADTKSPRAVLGDLYDVEAFGHSWPFGSPQQIAISEHRNSFNLDDAYDNSFDQDSYTKAEKAIVRKYLAAIKKKN